MALQVLFFGTSEFSIPTLEALSSHKYIDLKAVVTQPDKPAGRGQELTPPPAKKYAQKKGLSVLQPEKVKNNTQLIHFIQALKLDVIVVISYGAILPKEILSATKHGAINIHPSLLPKYRGASPMNQTLLQGDKKTGVTMIRMNEKMDEGDIIFVKKIKIEEEDNYLTLSQKLANLAGEYIVPVLIDYTEGILRPIPQKHEKASYCKKMEKSDGKINWEKETAEQIHNKIRAFVAWPGTFTTWNGKMLKIKKAFIQKTNSPNKPGIIEFKDKKISIACKKGALVPEILQLEGKKEVKIEEFLRGYENELRRNPIFGI